MWLITLKAIGANILVFVAAFGFGTLISRLFPDSFSRLTKSFCGAIGGFGLLGLVLFVVGYLSFTRLTIGFILALGVGLALFSRLRPWETRPKVAIMPATIVAVVLAITAIGGLAEPVGDWGIDGVAYHLLGPKVWLRNGVVRPIPDNMNTSYPSTVEMVFGGLLAFGGDRAAGFSAAWTLTLLLAIAASLGQRCGLNTSGAWWVAALIGGMPAVYEGSHSGFVDACYAAFILAAVRVGLDAQEKKHFVAFGLFCGLAMATKYPALLAVPALIFCAVWTGHHRKSFRAIIPNASIAALTACVFAAPIYLKNWIFLGTPIYPPPVWVTHFVHVKYFPAEAIRDFYAYNIRRGNGHGRGILHFFTLPFNLTYHPADFSGAGGIGLAPLAFAPFGAFASWRESFARRLALVGLLLLILWFATMQESRYLFHVYAVSAVFAVLGWQYVASFSGRRGKLLCAAVIAISTAYGCFMIAKDRLEDVRSVLSPTAAEKRRQAGIQFVESFDYLNHDPLVTRLLIVDSSVVSYFSDKSYIKPFGQWGEQVFPDVSNVADILPKLNELHVSHILDVQSTISSYCIPPNYPGLVLVFERPGQKIYRVVPLESSSASIPNSAASFARLPGCYR